MALPLAGRVQAAIKLNDIVNELIAVVEGAESHLGAYDALTADEKTAMVAVLTTAERVELVAWFGVVEAFATDARAVAPAFLPPPVPPEG